MMAVRDGSIATTELLGNDAVVAFFEHAIERDRLAHAYLIVGPDGVGKRALARRLAAMLLGGDRPLDVHPDYFEVVREEDEKTGNLNAGIRRHQTEALRARLASAAMMGGWKVAVIDHADTILHDAANLLLKTIEEPFARTLIIMLASSAENVMPTLRSRCQTVVMRPVPEADITAALVARGVSSADASLISRLAAGRPGRAIELAGEPSALERLRDLRATLLNIPEADVPARWSALESMIPPKAAFNEAKVQAETILEILAEVLRDALLAAYGEGDRVIHVDVRDATRTLMRGDSVRITAALVALAEARTRIAANVNSRTVLQQLFAVL